MGVPHPERQVLRLLIVEEHAAVRIEVLTVHETECLLLGGGSELDSYRVAAHTQDQLLRTLVEHLAYRLSKQVTHRLADLHTTTRERHGELPVPVLDEIEEGVLPVDRPLHERVAAAGEPGPTGVDVCLHPGFLVATVLR